MIRKILIIFVFFLLPFNNVYAADLAETLKSFLISQTPSEEENQSTNNLSIPIKLAGNGKEAVFVMPMITVAKFVAYLSQKHDFANMIEFCQQVKKVDNKDVGFWDQVTGQAYEEQGEMDRAIDYYLKAYQSKEQGPFAAFRLWGIYNFYKDDKVAASEWLGKFSSTLSSYTILPPDRVKMNIERDTFNFGNYFLNEARDFDRANKYFEMVLQIDPENSRAKLNILLGKLNSYIKLGDKAGIDKTKSELKNFAQQTTDQEVVAHIDNILKQVEEK